VCVYLFFFKCFLDKITEVIFEDIESFYLCMNESNDYIVRQLNIFNDPQKMISMSQQLNSPYLVPIKDAYKCGDFLYAIIPVYKKGTLSKFLSRLRNTGKKLEKNVIFPFYFFLNDLIGNMLLVMSTFAWFRNFT
jgi:hypothetical protein